MYAGALAYPDREAVFPVAPEMIEIENGAGKNDCEQSAARRFQESYRREHPHPEDVVLQDGPASKGPNIKPIRSRDLRYILGAKPGDRGFPFDRAKGRPEARTLKKTEGTKKERNAHKFRRPGDEPPYESQFDVRAALLVFAEARPDGSKTGWSRAARSRWSIENE
ncbi:MAG: hypothetical protein OXI87_13725 [Albidovulum sp.]|nr:hypothetical protein [Albidovulum sp.]MDE0531093.1 hypothetical protein [Albidovulum sp.]